MHIEAVVVLRGERQACQKCVLIRRELPPRPFSGRHRVVVHPLGHADRGRVVVAEQRDGAARRKLLHRVDDEAGIGAIADEVAEKHVPIDRMAPRMRETGLERFPVAVDVGEDRDQHWITSRDAPCRAQGA